MPRSLAHNVGFPAFYQVQCYVQPTRVNPLPQNIPDLNISDDVVDFDLTFELDSPRPSHIIKRGNLKVFNSGGQYSSLLAKTRGVTISIKWSPLAVSNTISKFGTADGITFAEADVLFRGLAIGRESSVQPGEEYVTFELIDHWRIMESIQIKNSLFYDGYALTKVVESIAQKAGLAYVDAIDYHHMKPDPGQKQAGPKFFYLGTGTVYSQPKYRFSSEVYLKDCDRGYKVVRGLPVFRQQRRANYGTGSRRIYV